MDAQAYNKSVIGKLWTVADLPDDWPGKDILRKPGSRWSELSWTEFETEVREFQAVHGLDADGKLGPKTLAVLKGIGRSEPSWLVIARGEIGTIEVPGPKSNRRILEYHASTSLKATDDDVPWCSSFVNWCLKQAGLVGTDSAWARSWLQWGMSLDIPRLGAITVFSRGVSSGHVAFFLADHGHEIEVLGGNQSNMVKVSRYPKSRLLAYRWPKIEE